MANKTKPLSVADKVILRQILKVILDDDDLRKGVRGWCQVTTRDMTRLEHKLDMLIKQEVGPRVALP